MRAALRRPDFARLAASHGLATVAQLMVTLGLGVEVLHRTGSAAWVSVTVALGFAPYAALSGLAGVVADRFPRGRVLAVSAAARAVLVAGVAVGLVAGAPVWLLVAFSALVAVAATPAYPALAAATPQCVTDEELPAANALVTCVENVTWIAGPGVYGVLVLLGLDATTQTLVASALLASAAVVAAGARTPGPAVGAGRGWDEALLGVRLVARVPGVRRPMTLAVVDNLLYGYLVVAVVLLVQDAPDPARWLGRLNAALTLGAVAAMVVVGRLAGGDRVRRTLHVSLAGFAGCVLLVGAVGPGPVALVLLLACGATTLVAEVAAVTLLQRSVEDDVLARLFGVYDQLNVGAIAVGSAVAAPVAGLLGPGLAMGVLAVACVALQAVVAIGRGEPAVAVPGLRDVSGAVAPAR
ncbi:MFS transporter [Nocardioides marmoribigeumensis]|uniref:MFS family permease n=1 Tax=Nocardioides marmoribigeumensis TaxID=433649 RepID=A0ABU2BSK5_9ACTN|nr:MFS transporter [Nocardioides marmoribigeumensis]MDR7361251.1 MFS family permease [Nocardioides marmoribigeumensis]